MHAAPFVLARCLAFAAILVAVPAHAESAFQARGTSGTFVADDGVPLAHLATAGQLRLVWNKDPIVRRSKEGLLLDTVVAHQLDSQLVVGLGLFDKLELSAQLSGRFQAGPNDDVTALAQSAAFVTPRLSARVLVVDLGWLQTSARVRGTLVQDVEPGVIVVVDPGFARFTFDGGVAVSPTSVHVPFALSASVPVHERIAVTAEVFGAASSTRVPLEAMLGARASLGPVAFVAGVGGGLLADVGTPAIRIAAAAQWRFDLMPKALTTVTVEPVVVPVAEVATVDVIDVIESGADEAAAVAAEAVAVRDVVEVDEAGADSPDVHVDDTGVTFDDDVVLFPVDRDTLLPAGRRLLRVVASKIKQHPEATRIVIEGHADALGDTDFNRRLSSWRAHAVRRSLIAWGVAPERLVVRALGSQRPIAPNTTAAGRRQNRRVEITFETISETP